MYVYVHGMARLRVAVRQSESTIFMLINLWNTLRSSTVILFIILSENEMELTKICSDEFSDF